MDLTGLENLVSIGGMLQIVMQEAYVRVACSSRSLSDRLQCAAQPIIPSALASLNGLSSLRSIGTVSSSPVFQSGLVVTVSNRQHTLRFTCKRASRVLQKTSITTAVLPALTTLIGELGFNVRIFLYRDRSASLVLARSQENPFLTTVSFPKLHTFTSVNGIGVSYCDVRLHVCTESTHSILRLSTEFDQHLGKSRAVCLERSSLSHQPTRCTWPFAFYFVHSALRLNSVSNWTLFNSLVGIQGAVSFEGTSFSTLVKHFNNLAFVTVCQATLVCATHRLRCRFQGSFSVSDCWWDNVYTAFPPMPKLTQIATVRDELAACDFSAVFCLRRILRAKSTSL